jgi:hypothetical protein
MTQQEWLALIPGDVITNGDENWMVGARLPSGQNPDGRLTLVLVLAAEEYGDWTKVGNVGEGIP